MSQAPSFDSSAPHHQRPRLRQVRAFPAQAGEQMVMGLADARQVSDRVAVVPPACEMILPHFDGEKTLDEICEAVGHGLTREFLEGLVAQLDDAGLLFGPTFDGMLAKMRADFDSSPVLPPASTAGVADMLAKQALGEEATPEQMAEVGAQKLREAFDTWMDHALRNQPNPSFDTLPKGVIAPHLDYNRGWLNYACVYGRMRVVDRPDRIVILGTNHFGEATGVCGCDKGFQSPLGTSRADQDLIGALRQRLGSENAERLFANRFDHEREHSIELHIPWIHHVFGVDEKGQGVPVFAALVHDPCVNQGESYDGQGLGFKPFVEALKGAIEALPGKTLVVSSADLSHVGPAFGDEQALSGEEGPGAEARNKVFNHDREMLGLLMAGKTDDLMAAMTWQQNPTRWCSLGNMAAAVQATGATGVQIFNYAAALDEEGNAMVSNIGGVLV